MEFWIRDIAELLAVLLPTGLEGEVVDAVVVVAVVVVVVVVVVIVVVVVVVVLGFLVKLSDVITSAFAKS